MIRLSGRMGSNFVHPNQKPGRNAPLLLENFDCVLFVSTVTSSLIVQLGEVSGRVRASIKYHE